MPRGIRNRLAWATAVVVCTPALAAVLTTQDGVFTGEQAERGKLVYEESCVNCHELDFYEDKLAVWQTAYVADLFYALSATMPSENPGGLLDEQYVDVLAYIFSITGSPSGEAELDLANMASIEIILAKSSARP